MSQIGVPVSLRVGELRPAVAKRDAWLWRVQVLRDFADVFLLDVMVSRNDEDLWLFRACQRARRIVEELKSLRRCGRP